ncbi:MULTISPECIES: winged helix-turn-helix domain-containing protein [Streptomyces]|uniref:winged helix-turn-helix domain-containing protein n=1 Tax=Streptomyces TaxID=1883 RepID=UPI00093C6B27|nr:winged helix-turn-helix domain-containing protein [Streptomyces sp. CB02130]
MRLVESPHYSDAALSVYMKVKALGARPEGCTAGVSTLASYLGLSASTVHRGLAQLRAPAEDGVVELPDSRRRSLRGGYGTTARRRVRPMHPTERFIWLPVVTSEQLRPRLLRAYAVIAHAVAQKVPLTETVLAGFLRHHWGQRAGRPLTTEAAGRIVDELAETGWITVRRRAGSHGRHLFLVQDGRSPAATSASATDDRSGSRGHDVSLAYKEDLRIDRPENKTTSCPSAVGETPVVRAEHPVAGAAPRHDGGNGPEPGASRDICVRPRSSPSRSKSYTGPSLTFSARLHIVLEPVRFLLEGVSTYMQRRIGQEIAGQLDSGTDIRRLRERLGLRLAHTLVSDILDPGRWLMGVALPRWGCADPDCESGVLWSTGARCYACAEIVAARAAARRTPPRDTPAPYEPMTGPGPTRRTAPGRTEPPVRPIRVWCCPDCAAADREQPRA